MALPYDEGTEARSTDGAQRSLVKIVEILNNSGGGGGGTGATYSGSGSPEGVQSGNPGNVYWDATNNVFYVKDTGTGTNTGWRELVA
jgi:hypothetical protein